MVIKADQLLNRPSKLHRRYGGRLAMQKAQQEKMVGGASVNIVLTKKSIKNVDIIKTNVVKIESFFKGTLALDKKQLDDKKRDASKKRKEKIETKLETKPNVESGKISMPAAPRMGILDFVKNFIGNVLLGYFAIRLIKHLPKIIPIVKFLGNAADFIIDVGGKLLNGLVSFIDWGYKAYDATRGFIKNLGGENFAKGFDKFLGAIDTALFLTTALAGAMAVEALTGDGGPGIMDMFGKKGAAKAAGSAAKGAGVGAGAVAGIVAGAGLLASALGEGAFQLRKIATKPIQDAQKAFDNERNPLMKIGRGALLGGMYTLLGPLSAVGVLLDIVGAPFRYAIELLRFPFLSEEDKVKQANNLAKFDARIREDFRKALNMVTLGFAFKESGSFGNIYGNKGSQKEMMGKMQGGGITRGGKSQRGARRTISKGKYKRVLAPQKPTKTELKTEAFTKDKILKESTEQLDKTKYFGPILAISSKIMNKEEPTQRDYQNVGLGINTLISQGIKENQLKGGLVAAFAGGGLVDPDVLSAIETGGDISNWVAKTFRGEVESNAQKTMRMIREKKEEREKQPSSTTPTPDGFEVGPAGTSGDKLTMARNLMRDLGLTADQAAGIVGNMAAESGVENARVQGSRPGTKGALKVDGKTGYGIVQWTSMGRQQALADYAKSKGVDLSKPLSMNIEYQFFLKEFKGKYGHVLSQIKQARDVKTASTIFMQQYEIPAGYKTEAKIMERYNMSKPIYDKLAKGEGKATEGPGTYIGAPTNMELGTQSGSLSEAKSLAESMKVPLFSHVRPNSTGYHRTGRAMDFSNDGVGNGTPQQLSLANEFVKRYGATAKEIFYTPLGFSIKDGKKVPPIAASGHYNHVHIAFSKGGRVSKPTYALIGEKGPEFVFDADTTAGLDRIAPQLLEKLNIAKTKPQLSGILQSYAPYDAMSQQTIIVPTPSGGGDNSRYNNSSAGGGVAFMPIGGGGDDPFATLYQGG